MTEQENNKKTDEPQRNWVDIVVEVIALAPIAIVAFIGGMYLFARILNRFMPFCFFGLIGPPLVLGFDILWVIAMKRWQPRTDQLRVLKKILSVTVYAVSVSALFNWYIFYLFEHVW